MHRRFALIALTASVAGLGVAHGARSAPATAQVPPRVVVFESFMRSA